MSRSKTRNPKTSESKVRTSSSDDERVSESLNAASDLPDSQSGWPVWVRSVVSVLLAFHLLAVVIAPLTMLMPAPGLTIPIRNFCAPYQQATYLDHGYQFFAPDPGPSHFVQYVVITNSGERVEGRFPDREQHWPRLHYHRWFMLSERIYSINDRILSKDEMKSVLTELDRQIAEASANSNSEAVSFFIDQKEGVLAENLALQKQSDRMTIAIRDELARRHEIRHVEIYLVERTLPAPYQITTEKKKLDDPQFLPIERRIQLKIPTETPDGNVEEIR